MTPDEDILHEALRLTSEDRQNQYGPPDQDFARTAGMWSALFGHKMTEPFEPRDIAMAMICLKLSRETHQRKRDNAVDGAGYFRCLHICNEAAAKPFPQERADTREESLIPEGLPPLPYVPEGYDR